MVFSDYSVSKSFDSKYWILDGASCARQGVSPQLERADTAYLVFSR